MKFEDAAKVLRGIPHMTPDGGKVLYDHVRETRPARCLELGFAHGVSTCYAAAALHENGLGHIITIDNQTARRRDPDIHTLLARMELPDFVTPIFSDTSYNWELSKIIRQQSSGDTCEPIFDLCFVDGAHSWAVDGLAFFLAEKLLKPGAWIVFDDLRWTFASSQSMKDLDYVKRMPDDERGTAQVQLVFDLLVRQHPGFTDCRVVRDWGWARKRP